MNKEYVKFYGWDEALMSPVCDKYKIIQDPRDLYEILAGLWSKETCAPRMREEWAEKDCSYGQCSITAFLVQDIFGGEVRGIELPDGNFHCFNDIDGHCFDLTSGQFLPEVLDYETAMPQSREVHFFKEEKRQRYELLKKRLETYLEETGEKCVLVTNDDGIDSEGLLRLAEAARHFGKVWVVAPDGQRSAASHSITIHDHIDLHPYEYPLNDVRALSCSGTPADCVRVGIHFVMLKKPDLILSGINKGFNLATDIQYSATAGAALEGSFQGVSSIAVSEGPGGVHDTTDHWLVPVMRRLSRMKTEQEEIFNINFPDIPVSECRGLLFDRKVSKATVFDDRYVQKEALPNDGYRVKVNGTQSKIAEEGTDYRAVMDSYISVSLVKNIG